MQLIKPSQISGEIMTLIEEADKKLILISPYFKIGKWYKLLNRLETIKKRNLEVEIYVREGEYESIKEVFQIGFQPITIPNLHTKLYLNEKEGIVSSMNLLLSSDTNSLDIALKTENKQEYDDLFGYYTRYIQNAITNSSQSGQIHADWREALDRGLSETLGRNVYINEYDGKVVINTSNKYEVFIANGRSNDLRISGILSSKEFDYTNRNKGLFQSSKMEIDLIEGKNGYYDMIWGTMKGFKSWSINDLKPGEDQVVVDAIVKFIRGIEQLKKMVR